MEITSIYVSSGIVLAFLGFLLKWIFADMNKKFDLLFAKIDEMAKQSEIDSLRNLINQEVEKKESRFKELETRMRIAEDTQNRCKSCKP